MIISASRRTDIPAYFMPWMMKRLEEGFVLVRNPMNPHQISRIQLTPETVDCIVFWSKNPAPLLPFVESLESYMYYIQYTLNAYDKEIEPNLPSLENRIQTLKDMSRLIGKDRVVWRYDPIAINQTYTVAWHIEHFKVLASQLSGFTDTCMFSFLDIYTSIKKALTNHGLQPPTDAQQNELAYAFSSIAAEYRIQLKICCENDYSHFGIQSGACIDQSLIEKLLGCDVKVPKDKTQRPECHCISSIDIGIYHTCRHVCIYCYANHRNSPPAANALLYDISSPLLCGNLMDGDKITDRKTASCKNGQITMQF